MNKSVFLILLIVVVSSCKKNCGEIDPLVAVISVQSAEAIGNRKFTNVFQYADYDISSSSSGTSAIVSFTAKDPRAKIKKLDYILESVSGQWKVVSIQPHRRDSIP